MGRKVIDLTGKQYGRWKVLMIHPERRRRGRRHAIVVLWHCVCDCGTERLVAGANLRYGRSISCGCFNQEQHIAATTKHGHARDGNQTRAYRCWVSMRQRCFNSNHKAYVDYGGRGITICDRWLVFENFYADMGDPADGMSLDRIDNDANYEPSNCQWASRLQQTHNRRPRKRKRRRADAAEIRAYTDALARARGDVERAP